MKRTMLFAVVVCFYIGSSYSTYAQTRKRPPQPQPKTSQPQLQKPDPPAKSDPISGEWTTLFEILGDFSLSLKLEGEAVTGKFVSPDNTFIMAVSNGSWIGNQLNLKLENDKLEEAKSTMTINAVLDNGKLTGTAILTNPTRQVSFKWEAWRKGSQESKKADPSTPEQSILDLVRRIAGQESKKLGQDLAVAASKGDFATVQELLAKGADVNVEDAGLTSFGLTPLMFAAAQGQTTIVQALLEK
ncbi:MAG: ankyrin repeat domain-containing protein, partial [Blastocatellia bacterium]